MGSRALTSRETDLLKSVFGSGITFGSVKIHDEKWTVFQPGDTAMTPNREMYWPPAHTRRISRRRLCRNERGLSMKGRTSPFVPVCAPVSGVAIRLAHGDTWIKRGDGEKSASRRW